MCNHIYTPRIEGNEITNTCDKCGDIFEEHFYKNKVSGEIVEFSEPLESEFVLKRQMEEIKLKLRLYRDGYEKASENEVVQKMTSE